jgi:hypothetical protein
MAIEQSRFRADASPAIVSSRAPSSLSSRSSNGSRAACDGARGVIARTSKPGSIRASGPRAQYVIADQRVELLMVPIRDGVTLIRRR